MALKDGSTCRRGSKVVAAIGFLDIRLGVALICWIKRSGAGQRVDALELLDKRKRVLDPGGGCPPYFCY